MRHFLPGQVISDLLKKLLGSAVQLCGYLSRKFARMRFTLSQFELFTGSVCVTHVSSELYVLYADVSDVIWTG